MPSAAPMAPTSDDHPIDSDVRCRECGYLLRGLRRHDSCPECGADVLRSIRGFNLEFRAPRWVRTIRQGFHYLLWGLLIAFLGQMVGSLLGQFSQFIPGISPGLAAALSGLVMGLCLIPIAVGVWKLTTPDPGAALESRPESIRRWARGLMLLQIVSGPIGVLSSNLAQSTMFGRMQNAGGGGAATVISEVVFYAMIGGAIATIVTASAHALGVLHVRELTRRIPRPSEAKQLKWCVWMLVIGNGLQLITVISLIFLLPAFLAEVTAGGGNQAPPMRGLLMIVGVSIPSVLGGLLLMVAMIWVLVILIIVTRAMKGILAAAARHDAEPIDSAETTAPTSSPTSPPTAPPSVSPPVPPPPAEPPPAAPPGA